MIAYLLANTTPASLLSVLMLVSSSLYARGGQTPPTPGAVQVEEHGRLDPPLSEPDQTERHPYFTYLQNLRFPGKSEPRILLDGWLLPVTVDLPCSYMDGNELKEVEPITMRLVPSGSVEVDGILMDVDAPFYIATTELSNAQNVSLYHVLWYENRCSEIVGHEMRMARDDLRVTSEFLPQLEEYLRRPNCPALGMGMREAALRADSLGGRHRLIITLPTLAQWFRAMQGDSGTWSWNQVDLAKTAWRFDSPVAREGFEFFRDVKEGESNRLGLHNLFGNAAELVYPSADERRLLRRKFGRNATNPPDEWCRAVGFEISETSVFAVGGSAITRPVLINEDTSREVYENALRDQAIGLRSIVSERQFIDRPLWSGRSGNWATGVRFVMLLPEGEIEVESEAGENH